MTLQDSGKRRLFETGAVRDVCEGKGRLDLMPVSVIGKIYNDRVLQEIGQYVYDGDTSHIESVLEVFIGVQYHTFYDATLEVSKHYEEGAIKYKPRNWERGMPLHCYVDSGIRHYLKFMRGDTDEPHDKAFIWNMLGLLWTHQNKPRMHDLPFAEVEE